MISIHSVDLRIFTQISIHFAKFRILKQISIQFEKFRIFTPIWIQFLKFRIFQLISIHFVRFRIFSLISISFINIRINTSISVQINRKMKILRVRILWILYLDKLDKFIFQKRGFLANHWAAICRIRKNVAFWLAEKILLIHFVRINKLNVFARHLPTGIKRYLLTAWR